MADSSPPPVSPFPTACVARVLDPHGGKLGGTLVARQLAFLAIKITFHKQPVYDLEVKFYAAQADGSKGPQVGDKSFKTDRAGKIRYEYLVPPGVYLVEIENQHALASVASVRDLKKPYVVPLPVGRPYFDFDEDCEFDDEHIEVGDYVSAASADDPSTADSPDNAAATSDAVGADQWDGGA